MKVKGGVAIVALSLLGAGCGASAGAQAHSSQPCWNAATHRLAVHQAKVFLGPAGRVKFSRATYRKIETLNRGSDMRLAQRWSQGKHVVLRALPHERYLGPTRAWLRATKASCGSLST